MLTIKLKIPIEKNSLTFTFPNFNNNGKHSEEIVPKIVSNYYYYSHFLS